MTRMLRLMAAVAFAALSTQALAQGQRQTKPADTLPGPAALTVHPNANAGNRLPDATIVAPTCPPNAKLPNNGGTSGNARAPSTRFAFERSVYLIRASELATAGYPPGASPATIGWNYQAAPGVSGAAPLIVYMENTSDTTNTKSTTWATAISTMTVVHNAVTTLPGTVGPFDITLTGGSPFTYTGGGLYIAFDWGQYTGTLSTTAVIFCNTALNNGLFGAQSNTAAPTTIAASAFRPETRLSESAANDASVSYIYSLGEQPPCLVGAQTISARIVNTGSNTLTNLPVTLNVTGADTFTDTQTIASLASCGGQATVTFASYTPGAIGNGTVTVSVPADDVVANSVLSRPVNSTQKAYSYKYPGSTAGGGVGLNAPATGAFVAKFSTSAADAVTDVKLEFPLAPVAGNAYRVAIYGDNAGVPSTTALYVDASDRNVAVAGPVTITLPSPVAVGPGNFYVGIQQTAPVNIGLSFDTESPIRTGTFFFANALPVVTWNDLAPNNSFKLNIGLLLQTGCVPPACIGDADGNGVVNVNDLLSVITHWGACPPPCPPCIGDLDANCTVDVNDLLAVITHWGACP